MDDDTAAIRSMQALLSDFPNQRFATSGRAALDLAREWRPDLIVLDMNLPDMNGLEVCTKLKANPWLYDVPVIMATSHDRAELELLALERGAADFVSKPLQPDQFRARVRAQLHANRAPEIAKAGLLALYPPSPVAAPVVPRLLIVDDDVASIHFIRNTLAQQGNFYYATTGPNALQLAQSLRPDLIVLDAHMPGMDGFAVCEALQAQPALARIPVVFVTRYSDPINEARALDLGAADFVSKPYTPAVLQARVRNLLELKRRNNAELRAVGERWRQLGDTRVADIVRAASDAIVSSDESGRVVLANASASRLFGISQEEMIGRRIEDLPCDITEQLERLAHEPARVAVRQPDGRSVWVEMTVSRLDKEEQRLTTLVLRDVSDRDRIEALARERAAAEAAYLTKSRLLSYVAHEMGNPLHAVLGLIELVRMDEQHPLTPQQAQRMDLAKTCAKSLEGLLRDLLDMGRRESADFAVACSKIDMAQSVHAAVEAVAATAAQAGVELRLSAPDGPVHALADGQRLHQCLVNLLTNAIKYNERGGWAEARLSQEPGRAVVSVSDNGVGIDGQKLTELFQPFNRLGQGDNPGARGTGLGLVITRQLVETMNGRLLVESRAGLGSCFSISLPTTS